jgi:hypothetical protein
MVFPTLKASELCEERADLVTWLEDPGPLGGQSSWAMGLGPRDRVNERVAAKNWATSLRAASLTYTTTQLTRTALAAGDAFDDFRLEAHDIPSPHGFISWEEPITAEVFMGSLSGMSVTAATWAVKGGMVEIRWWTDKNSWVKDWSGGNPGSGVRKLSADEVRATHRMHPTKLVAVGCSTLLFGSQDEWPAARMPPPPGASTKEREEYALGAQRLIEAEKTLTATWLLMNQTLVVDTPVHTPKSAVKRIGRLDPSLLGVVRQVTLRHKNIAPDRVGKVDGAKREYAHRWLVGGHWRNQPYPSVAPDYTQRIWISDFFKGPEGAPLLDPSKLVNVLRR